MIGQIVGNYKIVQKLGEGGVGAVFKGVDTMLDREVAIKVLRPELASQTTVVERFRSEAVTLAKLNHPNIATLFSLFRHGNDLVMVLEFIKGETLDELIQRRGVLPAEEAIPIFCQALDGINHAHELGIIHRDIKPGNMMLTANGTLKVLDFGIARLLGSSRMTRVGNIIGTLEYMSPEQVRGHETDARSDIYGLGIMLYEVLTGRLPFVSENDFELMKMQTEDMPMLPRSINPAIPADVEAAILKAMAKKPADRFQTAADFMDALFETGLYTNSRMFGFSSLYQSNTRRPSKPPISQDKNYSFPTDLAIPIPDVPLAVPVEPPVVGITAEAKEKAPGEIKETRLGTTNSGVEINHIKETRLGTSVKTEPENPHQFESRLAQNEAPSFLSRLTWFHYSIAGGAVIILLSFMAFAAVLPIMFSGSNRPVNVKPNGTNKVLDQKSGGGKTEEKEEKPAQTPQPAVYNTPVPAPTATPYQPQNPPAGNTAYNSPADAPGQGDVNAANDSRASGKKRDPEPTRKTAPPPVRTPVKPKGGLCRAEQLLTGKGC